MPRELFKEVVSPETRVRAGSRYTMVLSVAAHVLIVAAVVIVPLMATSVMPPLASGDLSFMMAELPPAPPPLPSPPSAARPDAAPVNRDAAPTVQPTEIIDELPPAVAGDHVVGAIDIGPTTREFGPGVTIGGVAAPMPPPPPPVPQKPVRIGSGIREPVKTKHVPPVYPQIAINARIEGRVVIDAVIATDGVVREARILSGVPLLNQAALDAVKEWRYSPTTLNNVPVQVIMTVTVQFKLQH